MMTVLGEKKLPLVALSVVKLEATLLSPANLLTPPVLVRVCSASIRHQHFTKLCRLV